MKRPKKLPRVDARVAAPPPRETLRARFFAPPDPRPGPRARSISRQHLELAISGRAAVAWVTGVERTYHPGYVGEAAIEVRYAFEDHEGSPRASRCVGAASADGERGSTLRGCLRGKKRAFTVLYDDERCVPVWWLFSE